MTADPLWRVVIDTNVWISAFLTRTGAHAELVRRVLTHGHAVFSPATFTELSARLSRPKFDAYLSAADRERLLHDTSAAAYWVDIPPHIAARRFSSNPDDDAFVHAALAASAALIVTGDNDLLSLHPVDALPVLTPRAALSLLTSHSAPVLTRT